MAAALARLPLLPAALLLAAITSRAASTPASQAHVGAKPPPKPIITTNIIYGTAELLYDIYGTAWNGLYDSVWVGYGLDKSVGKAVGDDPLQAFCAKVGLEKKELVDRWATFKAGVVQIKAAIGAEFSKAYEPLNRVAVTLINHFERLMPDYKGTIPKNLGDLLVFLAFISVVLYVLFKILIFAFLTCLSIFCYIFCCGCRKKRTSAKKNGSSKKGPVARAASAGGHQASPQKAGSGKKPGKK